MDYTNLTKEELLIEIAKLNKKISELNPNIISHEDKLKLAILDRLPFSMWACDRNFNIVLWTCKSEKLYDIPKEKALGKNYLNLFVDPIERAQSKKDCLQIIEKDIQQHNCCACDLKPDGSCLMVVTNVFRIWDEEKNDWLQAEVGLDISDYDKNKKILEQIRETEINRIMEEEIKMKQNIRNKLDDGFEKKLVKINDTKDLDHWLRKCEDKDQAHRFIEEQKKMREVHIKDLTSKKMELMSLINNAITLEELFDINDKVVKFNVETI